MKLCEVQGCENRAHCRGWCPTHYSRWYRHGDPLAGFPPAGQHDWRFWKKVIKSEETECWQWTGTTTKAGYGQFWSGSYLESGNPFMLQAHRWAYERFIGSIPEGLVIDHTCHNDSDCPGGPSCLHRSCVNPAHLEPVEQIVNAQRGRLGELNRSKTHCPRGHPYEGGNLYIKPTGSRVCRACQNIRHRESRGRQQAPSPSLQLF